MGQMSRQGKAPDMAEGKYIQKECLNSQSNHHFKLSQSQSLKYCQ